MEPVAVLPELQTNILTYRIRLLNGRLHSSLSQMRDDTVDEWTALLYNAEHPACSFGFFLPVRLQWRMLQSIA